MVITSHTAMLFSAPLQVLFDEKHFTVTGVGGEEPGHVKRYKVKLSSCLTN
jgi:hypothetical protein